MLLYRVIQGLGGGSLIPLSQAILRETYPPEEQGMAMAIFGMGVAGLFSSQFDAHVGAASAATDGMDRD